MSFRLPVALLCACVLPLLSQETRSIISGRVLDPSGAAIPAATVRVTNTDTNSTSTLVTNESGYYEANLLLPGNYRVAAELAGFKQTIRTGLVLSVSSRLDVDLQMQLGAQAESVSVTAEAPLLDTSSASSGRVIDNTTLMNLPVLGNSVTLLTKFTPGIQTGGTNGYLGLHSNVGGSDYNVNGNTGGNEWAIDGVPNNGNSRRTAYLPYSDTIAEFKVETGNFDASIGHSTGASIAMITKSGTNAFHGTLTEQHWQQRWNGTAFFTKQAYYRRINEAEAKGDSALAADLRKQDKQPSGRSNNWAGTVGGPVVLPKIYNGKDKLFFFFSYNGFKDVKSEEATAINRTVPTAAERDGDFSQLLKVDPVRYQIYDPLSVRPDPARASQYIRSPFNGNIIPKTRFQNPVYAAYTKLLPLPNNPQADNLEQRNNYLAIGTPFNWDYKAFSNRVDYGYSEKHRFFGRWSWNDFLEDRGDWTYETARGLHTNGLNRRNAGATIDWVWSKSSATIFDFAVAVNQFREGSIVSVPLSFKPTSVGLPKYLDDKAADQTILPFLDFPDGSYQDIGRDGVPTFTRFRMLTGKTDVTMIRGKHSIRAGVDARGHFRTGGGGGNTSSRYAFNNQWTRRNSDTLTPAGNLGHVWASFLLGFPNSMQVATNDNYALNNPYYAGYVQENWRLTPRLSLNFGLRVEYERGFTERYNRIIGAFDPSAVLPISAAAEAAYAANPVPEVSPANFKVAGGSIYPGTRGSDRQLWRPQMMFLPRVAAAYQLNSKTVVRGGYGMFFDTLNVLNQGASQTNYSRTTSANISNDFGYTWLVADPQNGKPPMSDPFPIRVDGTRFDVPTRDALGLMAVAGRSFTFDSYDQRRARQQRWRLSFQRQLGKSYLVDAAYAGSYSDRVYIDNSDNAFNKNLNALPEQYYASGMVRNDALATNLNQNVRNPFLLSNFASLRQTDPLVYTDMSTQGFFTSSIIAKNRLLRPYPQMGTDVIVRNASVGKAKTHALEISGEKRFAQGYNFNVGYTWMSTRTADIFFNPFDPAPSWRESNDGRPHRLTATSIVQLPFGKGKPFFVSGPASWIVGGWQFAVTYEYSPGPLLGFGNIFFYGNVEDIGNGSRSLSRWFNTDNFERVAARGPASYHLRVFPTRIEGLRRDSTNQWNTNVQRDFRLREGISLQLRLDAINVANRSQFDNPTTDPYNTNFGRVTQQTATTNRFIQIQGRLTF